MLSLTETDFIQFLLKKETKPKFLTFPSLATFPIFTCIFAKTTTRNATADTSNIILSHMTTESHNFTVIQIFKIIMQTVHFIKTQAILTVTQQLQDKATLHTRRL